VAYLLGCFGLCGNKPFQPDTPPFSIQPNTTFDHSSAPCGSSRISLLFFIEWIRNITIRMVAHTREFGRGLVDQAMFRRSWEPIVRLYCSYGSSTSWFETEKSAWFYSCSCVQSLLSRRFENISNGICPSI